MRILVVGSGGVGVGDRGHRAPAGLLRAAHRRRPRRRPRRARDRRARRRAASPRPRSTRPSAASVAALARELPRRRRRQRLRPAAQPADLRRPRSRPAATTSTWRCTCRTRTPTGPYERDRRDARRRAVRGRPTRGRSAGLLALVGMGVEPGLSDVFARYAADHLFSTDRRDRRARRRRPRDRGLRLRADVLDLDDDRGVPQPAGRSGSATAAGSPPRRSPSRRRSCSPRASARSSA